MPAEGRYWGGQITIHPHEALMQQGWSFSSGMRSEAVADDAAIKCLFDVASVMHAHFEISVTGECWLNFSTCTSYTVGAGTSMSVFNRNTEFAGVNSFSALLFTGSSIQAGSMGLFQAVIPGGTKQSATGGKGETDEMHLHEGIYVLEVINKAGAAIDIGMSVTWEEKHREV